MGTVACLLAAVGWDCGGCSKKSNEGAAAPTAAALAPSSVGDAGHDARTWEYAIDPKSTVHVDLPGLKERIKGDATAAQGTLEVVANDLSKSRGVVKIDLTTFTTSTFGNGDDAVQTKHARTWLEVEVGDKMNETMRYAEFALRAIDGVSEPDLAKVEAVRDGADDVRRVKMNVHGDLLVHGHTVARDDEVQVSFRYPAGAGATSMPQRIEIESLEPLRVVLKDHDIRPRDPAGQLLEWTTRLIAKVADAADVTAHLKATPSPGAHP